MGCGYGSRCPAEDQRCALNNAPSSRSVLHTSNHTLRESTPHRDRWRKTPSMRRGHGALNIIGRLALVRSKQYSLKIARMREWLYPTMNVNKPYMTSTGGFRVIQRAFRSHIKITVMVSKTHWHASNYGHAGTSSSYNLVLGSWYVFLFMHIQPKSVINNSAFQNDILLDATIALVTRTITGDSSRHKATGDWICNLLSY